MTGSFHMHSGVPCWRSTCPQVKEKGRPWTEEELAKEGLTCLGLEAMGICPESGESFVQCMRDACNCFITLGTVEDYIKGCREELARQTAQKSESKKKEPHEYTGNTLAQSICSRCGLMRTNLIHVTKKSA